MQFLIENVKNLKIKLMSKTKEKGKIKDYSIIIGIVSTMIVVSLWTANLFYGLNLTPEDKNVRGLFGDMFGAVNAIFSGLAFSGIILSLYMQRVDLKLQRKELKLTRKEVKRTNKEFKLQNQTMEVQKFENQYYKMIDLHKQNVNEMIIPFFDILTGTNSSQKEELTADKIPNKILTEVIGNKGFIDMATELEECVSSSVELLTEYNLYENIEILRFAYKIFFWGVYSDFSNSATISKTHQDEVKNQIKSKQRGYKRNLLIELKQEINTRYVPFQGHESRLAHYYRHLFQIVKYVVQQEEKGLITYHETRQYLRVLRAQLSNSEQLMLYYNYICGFGENWDRLGDKGYQFLTKYRMIHNLPIGRVKIVEKPRDHFKEYISTIEDKKDTLFEWGDYD